MKELNDLFKVIADSKKQVIESNPGKKASSSIERRTAYCPAIPSVLLIVTQIAL